MQDPRTFCDRPTDFDDAGAIFYFFAGGEDQFAVRGARACSAASRTPFAERGALPLKGRQTLGLCAQTTNYSDENVTMGFAEARETDRGRIALPSIRLWVETWD